MNTAKSFNSFSRLFSGLFAGMLLFCSTAASQVIFVDTILYNGDPDKYINVVFMGDGYQGHELSSFMADATQSADYLFSISPFDRYRSYFNVFAIQVSSMESGAAHPRSAHDCPPASDHPFTDVDIFFSSTFDYFNIHRLLVPTDNTAAYNVLLDNFPLYDITIMLVNTPFYGGSGGWLATSSTDSSSNEIVAHEIGHSFADLADEYWAGDVYAAEKANMTQESDPSLIRWKNWLGYDDVGIYPYGTAGPPATWYRPHNNCKMRALNNPFCAVCRETITLKILDAFGTPVADYYPSQPVVPVWNDTTRFGISLLTPQPNTIRTKWVLNDTVLAINQDTVHIMPHRLIGGSNTLVVEVLDTTEFIRADNHPADNIWHVSWTLEKSPDQVMVAESNLDVKVYPVPVLEELTIEVPGSKKLVRYEIANLLGTVVSSGRVTGTSVVSMKGLAPGVYIMVLDDGQVIRHKKIVKK